MPGQYSCVVDEGGIVVRTYGTGVSEVEGWQKETL